MPAWCQAQPAPRPTRVAATVPVFRAELTRWEIDTMIAEATSMWGCLKKDPHANAAEIERYYRLIDKLTMIKVRQS